MLLMTLRLGLLDHSFYVFYGISFIAAGIFWLYQNKKNSEKFKKTHLRMIYNTLRITVKNSGMQI